MVVRVPVNIDVTDNDIAESIRDEVRQGSRLASAGRVGSIIGDQIGGSISSGIANGFERGGAEGMDGFTRDVNGRLRDTRGRFVAAGEQAGRGFGTGLSRGIGGGGGDRSIRTFNELQFSAAKLAAGITGLLGAVVPVGPALGGIAAGAVAVTGALGLAAGSAISAGGSLGALGLGAVTAVVASRGLTDALAAQSAAQEELAATGAVSEATQEKLTQAMEGLAPAARSVVEQLGALGPAWSDLQGSIQEATFAGVASQLEGISGAILPVLQQQLVGTAGVLNQAIQGFAQFAQSETFVSQLDRIISDLNGTLAALLPGIGAFGRGLLEIFVGAGGPARDVAEAISDVGARFASWAQGINESGRLTAFLEQANIVMGDLLGLLGNVGSTLVTVFGAGAGVGAELLSILRESTGQLAAFVQTAGAQAGLAQFFDLVNQTGDAISDLGGIIGPIFSGIFAVFGELIPQVNLLRDALLPVATTLGETLGTALTGLAPVIGLVASLIVGLVQALAPLVETIVGALGPALAELGALFTANLSPAVTELFTLLQPLLGIFLEIFGAQVVNAINLVVDVLGGVFEILGGLLTFLTGVFTGDWSKAWDGLVQVADGVVSILEGLVAYLWEAIQLYFRNGGDQALAAVAAWWNGIVAAFVQAQAKVITGVTRWVASVVRGFTNLRSNVVNYVKALWTSAGNLFTSGANRLGTIAGRGVTRVVSFFRELPGRIKNAVGSLGSLLLQAGKNVVQGLIDGITSQISRLAGAASRLAGTIRSYLPFSPAKVGPLSGSGSPDISGATIAQMVADGIQTNVNLPARAMQNALAPLAPDGAVTQSVGQGAARRTAPVASPANDGVSITQIFNGPTTSGGRLQEINWNVRYATQARRETIGGVAR
jgi:phage-related protein